MSISNRFVRFGAFVAVFLVAQVMWVQSAFAETITVTTINDELDSATDCTDNPDDCSLREAIELANDNGEDDAIYLPAGTYIISLETDTGINDNQGDDFDIDSLNGIEIIGDGADTTIIDGNDISRVFDLNNVSTFELSGVTIQNGSMAGPGAGINASANATNVIIDNVAIINNVTTGSSNAFGAGLYVSISGEFRMTNSLVYGNQTSTASSWYGGGIFFSNAAGGAVLINTTISNNFADGKGGGIALRCCGDTNLEIIHSTIVNNEVNTSTQEGAGIYFDSNYGSLSISNSILANNRRQVGGANTLENCFFANSGLNSGDYNIQDNDDCNFNQAHDQVNTDPELLSADIQDLGGPFNIYGLASTSPAIDQIPSSNCLSDDASLLTIDGRGMTRPENSNCDIGAYELDQTDPEISITAGDDTVECSIDTWTDAGATASDNFHDSITASTGDEVDETTLGDQTVTYTATDYDGNTGSANRTVTVVDTTNPAITLSGSSTVTLTEGDTYTDAGATATDICDGTLTDDIEATSTVNTEAAGTYTVTYSVADSSGNEAEEVIRTVTVEAAEEEDVVDDSEDDSVDGDDSSEDDTDNNAESGEGDGSDDTEETLGVVESLTRLSNNTVQVTYENGSTKTFQLFPNGSAKAKVQLHTNGNILIAINKKYIRTYDAFTGDRLYSKKLFKKKQYKTKFKRYNVYKNAPGKNNIMVLAQTKKKHKKQFKLKAFVVQAGGKIVVRNTQSVTTNKNTAISKLNTKKNNKNGKKARIIVTRKGKNLADHKYKVTKKKGRIVLAQ